MTADSALTIGAPAPIDNLGLVDLEAVILLGVETRRRSDGAVDVKDKATTSANQMMVVVANAILIPSG